MIDKLKIQQLRSLPIVGVAKRLNLTVSHKRCLCPFHDDQRPSLYLNKNLYHCFVCEAHGDPISLVQKVRHLTFTDACHWLDGSGTLTAENTQLSTVNSQLSTERRTEFNASRYSRFFEHPFLSVPAQDFLFRERHLSPQVIQYCRLNSYRDSHGTHWLQIPYYDLHGHLIGVQSRNLDYKKDSCNSRNSCSEKNNFEVPRFRFPAGSVCRLYNLPILNHLRVNEPLYIAEGCSDCWALMSAGHKAIAIPSATLLKPDTLEPIKEILKERHTPLHMYPDQDAPGQRLYLNLKEQFPDLIHHMLPEGIKDFSEYYLKSDSFKKVSS